MKDNLYPITLTHKLTDIHCGGFSIDEEKALGFIEGELFEMPKELFEFVTLHKKNLGRNLNLYKTKIEKNPEYKKVKEDVYCHTSTIVYEGTVFDTTKGIIVIEKDVRILPFTYLVGPLRIDEHATINPHAYISNSYVGKFCKIGGEVGNCIIESYSNKGHYGCIGDSFIGSWVNIGAGTSTSNLKNTYGTINMSGKNTSEQFLGSIICDYVKTAINTSIYTGKIIGTNAHIYSTVTTDVPAFANYISKNNMVAIPLETAVTTAERMSARRNVTLTEDMKKVLSYAYTETEKERELNGVKEGKLSF